MCGTESLTCLYRVWLQEKVLDVFLASTVVRNARSGKRERQRRRGRVDGVLLRRGGRGSGSKTHSGKQLHARHRRLRSLRRNPSLRHPRGLPVDMGDVFDWRAHRIRRSAVSCRGEEALLLLQVLPRLPGNLLPVTVLLVKASTKAERAAKKGEAKRGGTNVVRSAGRKLHLVTVVWSNTNGGTPRALPGVFITEEWRGNTRKRKRYAPRNVGNERLGQECQRKLRPPGQAPWSSKQSERNSARGRTRRSDVFLLARRHELLTARGTRRIRTTAATGTACLRFVPGARI